MFWIGRGSIQLSEQTKACGIKRTIKTPIRFFVVTISMRSGICASKLNVFRFPTCTSKKFGLSHAGSYQLGAKMRLERNRRRSSLSFEVNRPITHLDRDVDPSIGLGSPRPASPRLSCQRHPRCVSFILRLCNYRL